MHWCMWGLGAETWASEDRSGEKTGVGCTGDRLKGLECGMSRNWGCMLKKPEPTIKVKQHVKGGVDPAIAASFSTCSQWVWCSF